MLLIRYRNAPSSVFRLSVERGVRLVWSPDVSALAILDDYASNENRIIAVGLPTGRKLIEVSRRNLEQLDPSLEAKKYSHVYFEKLKWISSTTFEAQVSMYDRLSESVPPAYHKKLRVRCADR